MGGGSGRVSFPHGNAHVARYDCGYVHLNAHATSAPNSHVDSISLSRPGSQHVYDRNPPHD